MNFWAEELEKKAYSATIDITTLMLKSRLPRVERRWRRGEWRRNDKSGVGEEVSSLNNDET